MPKKRRDSMRQLLLFFLLLPLIITAPLRFDAVSIRPEKEVDFRSFGKPPGAFSLLDKLVVTPGRFEAGYASLSE
jgi:hypothetical protein